MFLLVKHYWLWVLNVGYRWNSKKTNEVLIFLSIEIIAYQRLLRKPVFISLELVGFTECPGYKGEVYATHEWGRIDLCTMLSDGSVVIGMFANLGALSCPVWWRNKASRVRAREHVSKQTGNESSGGGGLAGRQQDGKHDLVGWFNLPTSRLFAFYYHCAFPSAYFASSPSGQDSFRHWPCQDTALSYVCGLAFQILCSKLLLEPNQFVRGEGPVDWYREKILKFLLFWSQSYVFTRGVNHIRSELIPQRKSNLTSHWPHTPALV